MGKTCALADIAPPPAGRSCTGPNAPPPSALAEVALPQPVIVTWTTRPGCADDGETLPETPETPETPELPDAADANGAAHKGSPKAASTATAPFQGDRRCVMLVRLEAPCDCRDPRTAIRRRRDYGSGDKESSASRAHTVLPMTRSREPHFSARVSTSASPRPDSASPSEQTA